jgi:ribose/xylose/arabinose/galactoside ABC-type transport system permease subunit
MTVYQGLSYTVANQSVILNLPPSFKFLGQGYIFELIPVSVILMIIVVIFGSFVLNRTHVGRYIYAIGSNTEAAHLAGIKVTRIKLFVFAICGFLVTIATMILFARTGSAAPATGPGTEFSCMTACVLGGVSFKGGEGKIWGVVVGVLILGVLSNGMQLIGMGTYAQFIVKGFVLFAAVGFDTYQKISVMKGKKHR